MRIFGDSTVSHAVLRNASCADLRQSKLDCLQITSTLTIAKKKPCSILYDTFEEPKVSWYSPRYSSTDLVLDIDGEIGHIDISVNSDEDKYAECRTCKNWDRGQ